MISMQLGPSSPRKQLVTLRHEGLKSCSACKVPLLKKAHVQARLKFANDSEENWVKVLWSDETKIQLFGINSTRRVWRRSNAAYDPKEHHPHRQTRRWKHALGGGGGVLLRRQDNCSALKETMDRAMCRQGQSIENGSWLGYSSMTMTQNTRLRQQRSGSRRSTLWSWSGLASLQTLIP